MNINSHYCILIVFNYITTSQQLQIVCGGLPEVNFGPHNIVVGEMSILTRRSVPPLTRETTKSLEPTFSSRFPMSAGFPR